MHVYDRGWDERSGAWPATGMTLGEARAFAGAHSMRLPTVGEWMWIAAGPRGQRFPYAQGEMVSVANTADLGLGRLAPAGTFDNGRTPNTRVHDLLGNAWEWVADYYGTYPTHAATDPKGPKKSRWHVRRGGSHGSPLRHITTTNRDIGGRLNQVATQGFRVCRDAQ